jgi:hypothetical protein
MVEPVAQSRSVPDRHWLAATICLAALVSPAGQAEDESPAAQAPTPLVLDLRLGDLRRIVKAEELDTPLPEQLDDVTIWAHPETPDMVETRPVPGGLGGVFWGIWHPTQLWRLFVPDPNLRWPEEEDRRP